MSLNIKKIPIFVFPNTLKFYLGSKSSLKQLLTFYNPYDFPVKFKVLCTAPNKYAVIDPEGIIGPQSMVDVVIRHTMPTMGNCHVTDRFRISLQDSVTKQLLGKREIEAILLQEETDDFSSDRDFHSIPFMTKSGTATTDEAEKSFVAHRSLAVSHPSNYFIAIIIGLVCVVTLLLPTQPEVHRPSSIPEYLHISLNFKLVLAYVLGLVSMVIFKP